MQKLKHLIGKFLYRYKTGNHYIDLAPIDHLSNETESIAALHWAIKNKRVRNIALTGPYGSGKSSIINSYLKSYRSPYAQYIHDGKHLRVSMATFSEASSDKSIDFTTQEIEKEILKQFFYKVKSSKIPQSRYRKLHKRSGFITFLSALLLSILITAGCFVFFPDTFELLTSLVMEAGRKFNLSDKWIVIDSIISSIIILMLFSAGWNRFCNRLHVREIKLKDTTIASSEDPKESVFDKYMDEILYFFEVTDYNVVFFEDLDRLKSPRIFVKLRELNTILNNSDAIRRKITFVYAIKDDIFTGEDRTKFFEFIIPVIPIINSTNSGEVMLQLFQPSPDESGKDSISNAYILDVSPFISDRRILNNIYNEFQLYKRTLGVAQELRLRDQEMLSLIIFKNLYPSIFSDLQAEKGLVKEAFTSKRSLVEKQTTEIKQAIQNDTNLLDLFRTETIKNIKDLKIIFLSSITNHRGIASYFLDRYGNRLATTAEFLEDSFDIHKISDQGNIRIGYRPWEGYERTLDWPCIKDSFEEYTERLENLSQVEHETLEAIQQRIEQNQETIQNLSKMSIQTLIEKFGADDLFPSGENNDLLIFMLRNGYIDETYTNYMNYFKGNTITADEMNFILNIKNHRSPNFRYPLIHRAQIIDRLQVYEFEQEAALNFDLLEELLSNSKYEQKLQVFIQQLIKSDIIQWGFIDEFLRKTEYKEYFVYLIVVAHPNFWNLVYGNFSISYQHKLEYLKMILSNERITPDLLISQNMNGNLEKFITDHDNTLNKLIEISPDRMISIIEKLGITFTKISITGLDIKILDYIFDNGLYFANSGMIHAIVEYKDISLCDKLDSQNYTTLLELNYQPLLAKVEENLTAYIENVILCAGNSHESFDATMVLMRKNCDNIDLCEKVLQSQEFSHNKLDDCLPDLIEQNSEFVNSIWKAMLTMNRVNVSWDNIITYWIHFGSDDFLRDYISENISKLQHSDYSDVQQDTFENEIIKLVFNKEVFKTLSSVFLLSKIDQIKASEIPESNLSVLITSGKLPFSLSRHQEIVNTYPDLQKMFIVANQADFLYETPLNADMLEQLLNDSDCTDEFKRSLVANYCPKLLSDSIAITIIEHQIPVDTTRFAWIWSMVDSQHRLQLLINNLSILDADDLEKYFEQMDEPYASLANRSSRHIVEIPHTSMNLQITERLHEIQYITSFEIKPSTQTSTDGRFPQKSTSVIRCRIKVHND